MTETGARRVLEMPPDVDLRRGERSAKRFQSLLERSVDEFLFLGLIQLFRGREPYMRSLGYELVRCHVKNRVPLRELYPAMPSRSLIAGAGALELSTRNNRYVYWSKEVTAYDLMLNLGLAQFKMDLVGGITAYSPWPAALVINPETDLPCDA